MCKTCNSGGSIYRKQSTVIKKVERFGYEGGRLSSYTENVRHVLGGIDACPECASKSEVNYQEIKKVAA